MAFLADPRFASFRLRALCHNRALGAHPRLESITGSIEHRAVVDEAVAGVTHVLHLATSKETPDSVMPAAAPPARSDTRSRCAPG